MAKLDWDYEEAAGAYEKRPGYSAAVVAAGLRRAGLSRGMDACDVGAGTAYLTVLLLEQGLRVVAVEPGRAMRRLGLQRTRLFPGVCWLAALGEQSALRAQSFDLVAFGSSLNVLDGAQAVRESARLLRPRGWLMCTWNYRRLDDPLQAEIERAIRAALPGYSHGFRREGATDAIAASRLFEPAIVIEGDVVHRVGVLDWLEAWRSHATLRRQAGECLPRVLERIREIVERNGRSSVQVPYVTRLWLARCR